MMLTPGISERLDGGDGDTVSPAALMHAGAARAHGASVFDFPEVTAGVDADHHVVEGYDA